MAKKDKKKNEEELGVEESGKSKVVTALIVIVIVVLWLAVFGVLIKLDVGNFGSEVLYPVLKDVPVVNMILPEPVDGSSQKEAEEYDNLADANARIRELESQLAANKSSDSADSDEIKDLKTEVERLKKFEENQKAFAKRVKEFDENVVYNDKAPDTDEYKAYYEQIEPDNAEEIYAQVSSEYQYSQEVKDQADIYGKMEPAKAAAILEEMSSDLQLVASILDNMQASKSSEILANMSTTAAAQITTKMTAMKKN